MTSDKRVSGAHLQEHAQTAKELYEKYAPGFLGICLRYCANIPDAEDVLHDGFIKIIKNLHTFKPRAAGSFEGWMKRIIVNTALNWLRDRNVERKIIDGDSYHPEAAIADEEENWLEDLAGKISPDKVMDMIGSLPLGYRTVFNLYVFESFTHHEIAAELKCSENTSKSQLSKARGMLRTMIKEYYQTITNENEQIPASGR